MSQQHDKLERNSKFNGRAAETRQLDATVPTLELHPLMRLQRAAGNRAVVGLLESRGQLRKKLRNDLPVAEYEHEAVDAAEQLPHLTFAPPNQVQRKCATCTPASKCSECEEEEEEVRVQRKTKHAGVLLSTTPQMQRAPRNGDAVAGGTGTEPAAAATTGPLIVDDDAATVAAGQMRKSEFLEQLRSSACATADEALKEAGQSTEGCPYIEQWLGYYADREAAHIERALRKYAPEAATARRAHDYIPAVSNRIRQGVQRWARTGEVPDVPDELKGMMAGPGAALGAIGGLLGSIGSAIGGAFSSIGKALFKRKEGAAKASDDPQEIQSQLRGGQPLDGGAKTRMGAAFGHDFSNVRVHTNARATELSEQLHARAFTVGSDVAFGAGEYQPGTLIGDALIAHELAHVVQQQAAAASPPLTKTETDGGTQETEADEAAVSVVASLHAGFNTQRPKSTLVRSLRLQSCGSCGAKKPPQIKVPRGTWVTPEQADQLLANDPVIYPRIKDRVAKGRKAVGHTKELGSLDYVAEATEVSGEGSRIEDVGIEMMNAGGFADVDKGEIYLHRKDADMMDVMRGGRYTPIPVPPGATPVTIVHETVHLYQSKAWNTRVGHWANEGTTEYFTRRVLYQQKNPEVEGGESILQRDSYEEEYGAVKCLANEANDSLLADAYFLGQFEPLRKKVGEKKFDDWATHMTARNYAAAYAVFGCKPPEKQPEE